MSADDADIDPHSPVEKAFAKGQEVGWRQGHAQAIAGAIGLAKTYMDWCANWGQINNEQIAETVSEEIAQAITDLTPEAAGAQVVPEIHHDIVRFAPYTPVGGNNDGRVYGGNGEEICNAYGYEGIAESIARLLNWAVAQQRGAQEASDEE